MSYVFLEIPRENFQVAISGCDTRRFDTFSRKRRAAKLANRALFCK